MNLLPGCLPPQPEEIFESWFARMAFNHWVTPRQLYNYLLPDYKKSGSSQPLHLNCQQLVEPLSRCTLTNAERIQSALLINCPLYLKSCIYYNKEVWILPSVRRTIHSTKSGSMYCPKCLAADGQKPYFRQHWSLSFLVACPICNTMFLDSCPQCKSSPTYLYISLSGRKNVPLLTSCSCCGFNLATAPIIRATTDCLLDQQQLVNQLDLTTSTEFNRHPSYFFILHHALNALILLVRKRQLSLPFTDTTKLALESSRWGFTRLPIAVRSELLHWAIRLLKSGSRHYQYQVAIYLKSKTVPGVKYPSYLLDLFFKELLADRSAEELWPLFGHESS